MQYETQEYKANNLRLHLLPPSPMREVQSIKFSSTVNTPVKTDNIPERVYILPRGCGSALRRTTPLRRNSSPYTSSHVHESPLFRGRYDSSNNKSANNNSSTDNSSSSIVNKDSTEKVSKFIESAHGKHATCFINSMSSDNTDSINAANEIRLNLKSAENLNDKNVTTGSVEDKSSISTSKNNTNTIVTQLLLEDELRTSDDKIKTNKHSLLLPSSALEPFYTHTPRRVHTICQSEQISSIAELEAKQTSLAIAASNSATPLARYKFTSDSNESKKYPRHCLHINQDVKNNVSNTPLKHARTHMKRMELYNLPEQHDKMHAIRTKEIMSPENEYCKQGLVQSWKVADEEMHHKSSLTKLQKNKKHSQINDNKYKNSGNHHNLELDCKILLQEQREQEQHYQQQQYEQHQHPECTPLHSRFLTRKMRSVSAHESKFEMKLNELWEMHGQCEPSLHAQQREHSVVQTSHCASYSRHTEPSVASDHSELVRPAKRNLERVSRRIFSPNSTGHKDFLENEELAEQGKMESKETNNRLSYFERNPVQHRLRSSSSRTSRSADRMSHHSDNELLKCKKNKVKQNGALLSSTSTSTSSLSSSEIEIEQLREHHQQLSHASEVSSSKTRGLWNLLHKEFFLPGANALAARRSAKLRSMSLQPYCSNGFYRRQPHRRGSSPAFDVNADNAAQEHENDTASAEIEEERVNETANLQVHSQKGTLLHQNVANNSQEHGNKLQYTSTEADRCNINAENNTHAYLQHRMERIERTATATPTSVLVPRGPPRLSSDYNDSDDDHTDVINDEEDDNNNNDNDNKSNSIEKVESKNSKVMIAINKKMEKSAPGEEEVYNEANKDVSIQETTMITSEIGKKDNKFSNVVKAPAAEREAGSAEKCVDEYASPHKPVDVVTESSLWENSPNLPDSEWTDTPLSEKGTREASEAPTLPYTKSASREFGSDDLLHSPYAHQHAYSHNRESNDMSSVELSSNNDCA